MLKRNLEIENALNSNVDGETLTPKTRLDEIREHLALSNAGQTSPQKQGQSEDAVEGHAFPPGIRVIRTVMLRCSYDRALSMAIGDKAISDEDRVMLIRLLGLVYNQTNEEEKEELFFDLNQPTYWARVRNLVACKYVHLVQEKQGNLHHTLLVFDEPTSNIDDLDQEMVELTGHVYKQGDSNR